MKKYKTIDEVIKKGQIMVNVPVLLIIILVPLILTLGIPMILPQEYKGLGFPIGFFGGMGLGFVLAWTWWSFKITKWRIWAFGNTKRSDWKALKRRAIKGQLIWEDGNKFEKTEFRNKAEQLEIERINTEISALTHEIALKEIDDDPSIPNQLDFYFKRSETILSLILPFIIIAMGLFIVREKLIIGLLTIGMSIYYTDFNKIKNINKKEIQFSISNEGIAIKKFKQFGFVKWEDVEDIIIDTEDGVLQLRLWEKEDFFEVTYNLNDYQIGDYRDFLRKVNVYLKRHANKENDSEQRI